MPKNDPKSDYSKGKVAKAGEAKPRVEKPSRRSRGDSFHNTLPQKDQNKEDFLNSRFPQRVANNLKKGILDSEKKGTTPSTADLLGVGELALNDASLDKENTEETKNSVADAHDDPEKMKSLQGEFENTVKKANGAQGDKFEFNWDDKNPLSVNVNNSQGDLLFTAEVGKDNTTYSPVGEAGLHAALKSIAQSSNRTVTISGTDKQRLQILTKIQTTKEFRDTIKISDEAWKGFGKKYQDQLAVLKGIKTPEPETKNDSKHVSTPPPAPGKG